MSEARLLLVDDEDTFREQTARGAACRSGYEVTSRLRHWTKRDARSRPTTSAWSCWTCAFRTATGSTCSPSCARAPRAPSCDSAHRPRKACARWPRGALDFLTKPCKLDMIEATLGKALRKARAGARQRSAASLSEPAADRPAVHRKFAPGARSPPHGQPRPRDRLHRADSRGERCGQRTVSRAVHRQDARARQPFIVVDCAALHEKLAAERVVRSRKGRVHWRRAPETRHCSRSRIAAPCSSTI